MYGPCVFIFTYIQIYYYINVGKKLNYLKLSLHGAWYDIII